VIILQGIMTKWTLGQLGKTNPIQTQYKANSNPIKAKTNPIQTQNKPNFKRRTYSGPGPNS
jgi:hypothetical protein